MTDNSVSHFDHDETGFASWLVAHPTGFVVNTTRAVPANYAGSSSLNMLDNPPW